MATPSFLIILDRPTRPQSVFIIGWWYSNPRTVARRSLDSVPLNLVYYFPCQTMVLVPPLLPHPIFTRVPCPVQFSRILSLFLLLTPLCPCLFSRPSTSSRVWSPVVRPAEVYTPPADCRPKPFSWFPVQRPV